MPIDASDTPWMENKREIIIISNPSSQNFILDLPTGRYRLDAGRRMRTLKSTLNIGQIQQLVDAGQLVIEKS